MRCSVTNDSLIVEQTLLFNKRSQKRKALPKVAFKKGGDEKLINNVTIENHMF